MQILIRDIPEEVAQQLEIIAKNNHYSSRNQLIIDILRNYTAIKEQVFVQALSPVMRSMLSSYIEELTKTSEKSLDMIALAAQRLASAAAKIDMYITDDFIYEENTDTFSSDRNEHN